MTQILNLIAAGSLATFTMILAMRAIRGANLADVNMLEVIGGLIGTKGKRNVAPALLLHLALGIAFAALYVYLWTSLGVDQAKWLIASGAIMGFLHGLIASISLVVLIAEYYPDSEVKRNGFAVAMGYVLGHVVYGGALGLFWSLVSS